jgi:CHAT domain-containing protein/tetratricopeptide (TPR) repeat protein
MPTVVGDRRKSLRATRDRQAAERLLRGTAPQPSDVARAISLVEGAVEVHRRTGPPEECAASWHVLGTAWRVRPDGDRGQNLERALDALTFALEMRVSAGPREEWARVLADIGSVYWQRVEGETWDNIERALGAWRAAADNLDLHASAEQAEQWARVTESLAEGYLRRQTGDHAQNVESAIAAIEAVAGFSRERGRHAAWARNRNRLANVLIEDLPDAGGQNIERAIEILTATLSADGRLYEVQAVTEVNLALAYLRRTRGDPAQNVDRAISCCRKARLSGDPAVAAQANATLGAGLLMRDDVEAAISHLRTAAVMFYVVTEDQLAAGSLVSRSDLFVEYAKAQFDLGHAYEIRAEGDADDNRDAMIASWEEAARSLAHAIAAGREVAQPWSQVHDALGCAYLDRQTGDRGDNIESAIIAFHNATIMFAEDSSDPLLATARHHLGVAYLERLLGDKVQNLRSALVELEAAGRGRTRHRSPLDWAVTQTTLGIARAELAAAGDGLHLADRAVEAHLASLDVLDRDLHAAEWRRTRSNLAAAYLIRDGGPGDIDLAIAALEPVVETDDTSVEWLSAAQRLGAAYIRRDSGTHGDDSQRAVQVWQSCLERYAGAALPALRHTTARQLGDLLGELGRWSEAVDAYLVAVEATSGSYRAAFLADSQSAVLASGRDVCVRAAYAMVRADPGRGAEALLMLEQGRARGLAKELVQGGIERAVTGSADPHLSRSYTEALARLREVEAVLREGSALTFLASTAKPAMPPLTATDHSRRVGERVVARMASAAMAELADITEQIEDPTPDFGDLSRLAAAATAEVPVVYLACTSFGSVVLTLTWVADAPRVTTLFVDDLDEAALRRVLGGSGGASGYLRGQLGAEAPLKPYVQRLLAHLGARLIRPLGAWLSEGGAKGVVLIPAGLLGLVPLHTLPMSEDPAARCLLDDFDVSFAPSAAALLAARETAAGRQGDRLRLAGIADPTMDRHLRWARMELTAAAEHFPDRETHSGRAATRTALIRAAEGASHIHLACHGRFDLASPVSSGLLLADGMLTVADLLLDRPFATARLVIASACQTAITEFERLPDEALGLPATLLAAGTPAVIGTLWPTDDLSAALIMSRFYRLHLLEALPPATALRRAQLWLRALTGEQLAAEVSSRAPMSTAAGVSKVLEIAAEEPGTRFYAAPAFWAPYVLIGA